MGYEAYKINAKFRDLSAENMIDALVCLGAVPVERFGGTVTMKITNPNGAIGLILREDSHVNIRFSPQEKVLLTIRFSKTSRAQIAGNVISLLKALTAEFDTVYIRDMEAERDIDLSDTAWLIKSVAYSKYDFEYYFTARREGCRGAFCPQLRGLPLARVSGL